MSDRGKYFMRHIDRVTVKGSIKPLDLFTVDLDYKVLKVDSKAIDM